MDQSLEVLESRMAHLRAAVREAVRSGDKHEARRLRALLRNAEDEWDDLLDAAGEEARDAEPAETSPREGHVSRSAVGAIPVREQVYQALTVLGAPAAPKLISSVHEAFFVDPIVATKLASLRRDEAASFKAQPYSRPYYICCALTFDRLAPARGLLAVSTWSLEQRIMGPLGPRADFLHQAARIAEQIQRIRGTGHEPSPAAIRLLRRFAVNIPGAGEAFSDPDPTRVIAAARTESDEHATADAGHRREAAERARGQLDAAQQLFGAPQLGVLRTVGAEG